MTLIDKKTGTVQPWTALQLAAYSLMDSTEGLVFDPSDHSFYLEGDRLPSVTGILRDEGFIDTRFFDDYARDRGSLVHLATHYDDMGELDEDSLDPVIIPYVEAWRKFKLESGLIVEESESPMYSATYRYAGIFDTRGVLPGNPMLKRAAVELHNDGTYKVIPYTNRQDVQVWLSVLACHTWKKNNLRRVA